MATGASPAAKGCTSDYLFCQVRGSDHAAPRYFGVCPYALSDAAHSLCLSAPQTCSRSKGVSPRVSICISSSHRSHVCRPDTTLPAEVQLVSSFLCRSGVIIEHRLYFVSDLVYMQPRCSLETNSMLAGASSSAPICIAGIEFDQSGAFGVASPTVREHTTHRWDACSQAKQYFFLDCTVPYKRLRKSQRAQNSSLIIVDAQNLRKIRQRRQQSHSQRRKLSVRCQLRESTKDNVKLAYSSTGWRRVVRRWCNLQMPLLHAAVPQNDHHVSRPQEVFFGAGDVVGE